MSRLVVTGFACPKASWVDFLGNRPNQVVIPLAEALQSAQTPSLIALAKVVSEQIIKLRPTMLIAHDFGVTTGLLGLMRARKKDPTIAPRVILFNGALRGFNIFQATHPVTAQFISVHSCQQKVEQAGGHFDSAFSSQYSKVKALYRQVIAASLVERAKEFVSKSAPLNVDLGNQVLVIESQNDPFIPTAAVARLARDITNVTTTRIDYGHFPYSIPSEPIFRAIANFENAT